MPGALPRLSVGDRRSVPTHTFGAWQRPSAAPRPALSLCPGPEAGVVVIFDRAVDCDNPAVFLVLRAFPWIANEFDTAGGEAVNAKPVINPNTKIFNGETVQGATGLRVAVGGPCSARGSPVLLRTGGGPLPEVRWIDRRRP